MTLYEVMPSDGVYEGHIDVSLQSERNNSSVRVGFENPRIFQGLAGFYLRDEESAVCLSDFGIETVERLDTNVFVVHYGESGLIAGIVFRAA